MDIHERQHTAVVINFFWGPGTATPESVNEEAALIAYEALEKAKVCSDTMNLVPRPTLRIINIRYVLKQLSKVGKKIMEGDTRIYHSCRDAVGVHYKSRITMALMGI